MAYVQLALLEDKVLLFDAEHFRGVVLRLVGDKAVAFGVAARVCDDARVFDRSEVAKILSQLFLRGLMSFKFR